MRRFQWALLAVVAVIGFASIASAADMPVKAPAYKAPIAAPVYNWTGWYVGGNVGYAWGRADTSTIVPLTFAGPPNNAIYSAASSPAFNSRGFTGGIQLGYNYQTNNLVWGIETDFNAFALKGSADTIGAPGGPNSTLFSHTEVNTDWLYTLRPRIGIASGQWLFYVTGGLAVTNLKYSPFNRYTPCGGPGSSCIESASATTAKAGWAAGGGVETALMGNWSVKAEYLYVDFGSVSTTDTDNVVGAPFAHSAKLTASIARLGLNYKFH